MKFDEIVGQIGEFGPYQRRIYFLICLVAVPSSLNQLAQVFLAGVPDHWCDSPEVQSLNCTGYNLSPTECVLEKKDLSIPLDGDDYSQCERYNLTGIPLYPGVNISASTSTVECGQDWIYDDSQYKSSIVSDFDLVCGKRNLPDLAQSIYFAGLLIGSVLWGMLADTIGRLPSFILCIAMELIVGVAVAFSPNFVVYTVLRFILAISNMGLFLLAFVIGTEFVGPSKRVLVGNIIQIFYASGIMLLALLAFLIRDWRTLQLVINLPIALLLLLVFVVTESPRWLLTRGRFDKAEKIIKKAAKVNGKKLPEPLFDEVEMQTQIENVKTERRPTVIDLFRTPNLRKRTLNLMLNWCVNSLVYYGLSLSTSDLGGNEYVSFFISGAVEVPAYIYCIFALERFGRRLNLAGCLILGGVACLITIVTPVGPWRITVGMIGKFFISASFAIVYVYSAELYPTPVRSVGMGISSMAARIGGITAPLILVLGDYWEPLPLVFFGAVSVLAGLLSLLLPETKGQNLPETIKEGEMFGKKIRSYDENANKNGSVEVESSLEGTNNPAFEAQ